MLCSLQSLGNVTAYNSRRTIATGVYFANMKK
jgi:hypothetical protein